MSQHARVVDRFSNGPCVLAMFVRDPQGGHMATGTVKKLVSDRGFGFITAEDGKEYFFHRNELESSSDFDRLTGGEKVEFDIGQSAKGPQAQKVRLV
jgi:CspA family cold shock protein